MMTILIQFRRIVKWFRWKGCISDYWQITTEDTESTEI